MGQGLGVSAADGVGFRMSAVEIQHEDIKDGDRIRITREITVERAFPTHGFVRSDLDGRTYFTNGAKIERLPKALPPLPIKTGSVVRVTMGHSSPSNWMLNLAGFWSSDQGGQKFPHELVGYMDRHGATFEVIA